MHPTQATSTAMRVLIDNVKFFEKFGNLLRSGTAFGRTSLILAASGNESDRFGPSPFVLGAAYPAATEGFLSVAALEENGEASHPFRVAGFSNAGAKFAGPGVNVVSSIPGGGLGTKNGTSMATAHIAGVAALWAQKVMLSGAFSAEKVLERLKGSAQITPGLDEGDVGVGIPQAPQAYDRPRDLTVEGPAHPTESVTAGQPQPMSHSAPADSPEQRYDLSRLPRRYRGVRRA